MTSRFVEVPAQAIRSRLAGAGFVRVAQPCGEEVYERRHARNACYAVKVYSSISTSATATRRCGEDAIRVVAVKYMTAMQGETQARGIYKGPRVYRTGTIEKVLDRMIERAREAYQACNEHLRAGNAGVLKMNLDRLARKDAVDEYRGVV